MEFVFWLRKTRNDLFEPAMAEAPLVEKAVRALAADPDCVFARMSGSGAYGLRHLHVERRRRSRRGETARGQTGLVGGGNKDRRIVSAAIRPHGGEG